MGEQLGHRAGGEGGQGGKGEGREKGAGAVSPNRYHVLPPFPSSAPTQ